MEDQMVTALQQETVPATEWDYKLLDIYKLKVTSLRILEILKSSYFTKIRIIIKHPSQKQIYGTELRSKTKQNELRYNSDNQCV